MLHFVSEQGKQGLERGKAWCWVKTVRKVVWEFPHAHPSFWVLCQSPCHWLQTLSLSCPPLPQAAATYILSSDCSCISPYLFNDFIQALVTFSLDDSFIHFIQSTNIGWVSTSVESPGNTSVPNRCRPSVMGPAAVGPWQRRATWSTSVLSVTKGLEASELCCGVQGARPETVTFKLRPNKEGFGWWRDFSKAAWPGRSCLTPESLCQGASPTPRGVFLGQCPHSPPLPPTHPDQSSALVTHGSFSALCFPSSSLCVCSSLGLDFDFSILKIHSCCSGLSLEVAFLDSH